MGKGVIASEFVRFDSWRDELDETDDERECLEGEEGIEITRS